MPSELGDLIRKARKDAGIGLRELSRDLELSPAWITRIECEENAPSISEKTLAAIASRLGLEVDRLLVLANRTPEDVAPESQLDVVLYRKVKQLTAPQKRLLLEQLDAEKGRRKR